MEHVFAQLSEELQKGAAAHVKDLEEASRMIGVNSLYDLSLPFILVLFTAGIAFLAAKHWYAKGERTRVFDKQVAASELLMKRIEDLERQLSVVTQTVVPISTAFQAMLIKQLTHYHTPVLDKLLEGLGPPYILTNEEEEELILELEARTRDMGDEISDSERDAATILPYIMKRVKAEAGIIDEAPDLKLVAVPRENAKDA